MPLGVRSVPAAAPIVRLTRSARAAQRPSSALAVVLLAVAGLLGALAIGFLAGLGSLLLLAPLLAIGGVLALLFIPLQWSVWLLLMLSVLVVGPAIYFASIDSARWLAPALALALVFPYLIRLLGRAPQRESTTTLPWFFIWYLLFVAFLAFSSALSDPRLAELLLSTRVYLAYIPLGFVLLSGFIDERAQARMWKFLMGCAVLQVPFVAYQAFVVAPSRARQGAIWDAVVGTFPGNAESGGANAAMSLFTLVCCVVAISMWRRGTLRTWQMLAVSLSSFAVILMGEVKAIVLLTPVALGLLYIKDLARRPGRSLAGIMVGIAVMAAAFAVYDRVYYGDREADWRNAQRPVTAFDSIGNQLNPSLEARGAIMGRMATFADWADRNITAEHGIHALLGYGAGSTQFGRLGVGEVAERLTYRADITATGLLLWDSGIVGHLLVVLSFAAAAIAAYRLAGVEVVPTTHRAILEAVAIAMVLYLLCLPYKDFMFRTAPSQVLLFFMLGYIGYWQRMAARSTNSRGAVVAGRVRSALGSSFPGYR